jgi:hypothetical protein
VCCTVVGVQDVLIYGPLMLIWWHNVLPLFVRYKIKGELNAANPDPIIFKAQFPPGEQPHAVLKHHDVSLNP